MSYHLPIGYFILAYGTFMFAGGMLCGVLIRRVLE